MQRTDAGQIDPRDAPQAPLQETELHQVDAVDLHVAGGEIAELQFHHHGFSRLEGGCLGQFDRFAEEVVDGSPGVAESVFDAAVFAHRVGGLAQAVVNLSQDEDRPPLVGAFLGPSRLRVGDLGLGHLAAHLDRLFRLSGDETAVADNVPEAVQQVALGIAPGIADARGRGLPIVLHLQQGVGRRKRGLVGGRVLGELGEHCLEHAPGPPNEVDAVDPLRPELGVAGSLGRLGVDPLAQVDLCGNQVRLGRIFAQQLLHDLDAAEELALLSSRKPATPLSRRKLL